MIRLEGGPGHISDISVVLPWERGLGVAQVYPSPDEASLTIVRGDGAVFVMDMDRQKFLPTPAGPDVQGRVLPSPWPISPDGSRVYLGYDRHPDNRFYLMDSRSATQNPRTATVDEIHAYDVSTWKRSATLRTTMPFWSLVLSNDGENLYALCPDNHSILVIDTATMRQTRVIPIGGTPTLAIVAP